MIIAEKITSPLMDSLPLEVVCVCACVRACVCGVCVCVCVCVPVWCSGLCSRFPIETLRVRSPPSAVTHVFLLFLYLWVVTNSQMCMSEYECVVVYKNIY